MDKSKSKSEHEFAATEYDNISPDNNDSVFRWHNFHSIEDDPFANESMNMPKSESSSLGGLLLRVSETTSSTSMNSTGVIEQASTSTISNNPSVSSSSSDQDHHHHHQLLDKSSSNDQPISHISSKKKEQKRIQQQRFAFVTKSEVDHLEDGYRWRKYGQKAVKNSPYPRSYYRCTNTKCTVKKRVERSSEDPTTVITTYEGQHCHQTARYPRGGGLSIREAAFGVQMGPSNSQHYYPGMHLPEQSTQGCVAPTQQPTSVLPGEPREGSRITVCTEPLLPPAAGSTQFPSDEGLLGDIVSPRLHKNFHP